MFHLLDKIDRKLRERVERIAVTAFTSGDTGVVEWTKRATQDALELGRLRDRDVKALERLEDTYSHEFYRDNRGSAISNPIYA